MGEVAEMTLHGDLCYECAGTLSCDGFGIPIYCHDCHSKYKKKCSAFHNGIACEHFYNKESLGLRDD